MCPSEFAADHLRRDDRAPVAAPASEPNPFALCLRWVPRLGLWIDNAAGRSGCVFRDAVGAEFAGVWRSDESGVVIYRLVEKATLRLPNPTTDVYQPRLL